MGRRKSRMQYLRDTERDVIAGQMDWKGLFVTKIDESDPRERSLSGLPLQNQIW